MNVCFRLFVRTMEISFIVLLLLLGALGFHDFTLPGTWLAPLFDRVVPQPLVVRFDELKVGFRGGLEGRGLKVFDRSDPYPLSPIASASRLHFSFRTLVFEADELTYTRLPASYYAPVNRERHARVEGAFPALPSLRLVLNNPDILAVRPTLVTAEVTFTPTCLSFSRIHLDWPETDEKMFLDGFCRVDLARQEVVGEVDGTALQRHIRPLLVALDVPVSLPYMDAFTEVRGQIPSRCAWQVNLVNNDFDMQLDLHPKLGRYRGAALTRADGRLDLHVETRGTSLNYHHTIGPITAEGPDGEPLKGTIVVDGLNGTNTVSVSAESGLAVAELLKIGGFTESYVNPTVCGASTCELSFVFPRAMTNNYEVLNGSGHLSVRDGQIMRLDGFKGLIALLADKVPGVSWLTDSTQASCDYVIRDGVLSTDNIYIEGSVYSIRMFGTFDAKSEALDFGVHVQFTKKDSVVGKILHPLTWPFTKLLLEFRLKGTSSEPKWEYVSVLDRVMEVVK